MDKVKNYLTVAQAAEFLGVCKDTLRRWDRAGKLKARRHPITGYRLYLKHELDAFLRDLNSPPPRTPTTKRKVKGRKGRKGRTDPKR